MRRKNSSSYSAPENIARVLLLVLASTVLTACQSFSNNETTYPYTYNENIIKAENPQRVVIAHTNLGSPSRQYLEPYASKIDAIVKARLEQGNFKVVSNREFQSEWRAAVRRQGAPYNEQTGHINQRALEAILADSLAAVQKKDLADAVIFTDIIERDVIFVGRGKRTANWDGVSRQVKLRGGGGQLSADFDWSQRTKAASLLVIAYSASGEHIFKGAGGLDVTREIDPRSGTGRFVRKRSQFGAKHFIEEGVNIALHPLVVMESYVMHEKP